MGRRLTGIGTNARPGAGGFIPEGAGLEGLRRAAQTCEGCELYTDATQTVFSSGSATARLALVGEQPGDVEDRRGAPFVGPAGQLLDRALHQVGIDRRQVYVTNAVKHFRFTLGAGAGAGAGAGLGAGAGGGGRRRIHQTPDAVHVDACKPWLLAELAIVDPEVVVLLGATAGRALLGPDFRVTRARGTLIPRPGRADEPAAVQFGWIVPTLHPSAILRADDQELAFAGFVADLSVAASALGVRPAAGTERSPDTEPPARTPREHTATHH